MCSDGVPPGPGLGIIGLEQGSSNLSLEVQSDAEFSSNPD